MGELKHVRGRSKVPLCQTKPRSPCDLETCPCCLLRSCLNSWGLWSRSAPALRDANPASPTMQDKVSLVGPKPHGLFASSPKSSSWGSIPGASCSEGQILLDAWVGKGSEASPEVADGKKRWILPALGALAPGQPGGTYLFVSKRVAECFFAPVFRWHC